MLDIFLNKNVIHREFYSIIQENIDKTKMAHIEKEIEPNERLAFDENFAFIESKAYSQRLIQKPDKVLFFKTFMSYCKIL